MPKAKNVTVIPATLNIHTKTPTKERVRRRAAAYARVSTDSEEQLTSYEAQVDCYTRFIQENPDWDFVEVYTDEAVIIGLKPPSTNGRRFSPISITGHFPI